MIRKKNSAVKKLLYVFASVLGIFVLVIVITPAFFRVLEGDSIAQQDEEIAKMEKYYQENDYEKMCEYLSDIGKSGGDYEKYVRLCGLYENMKMGIGELEKIEGSEKIDVDYLQSCLKICIRDLARIDEMESLNFPYNESEGAMYIRKQYVEALQQYMLLTEDEIASATISYMGEDTDYMELAEIALQRIEEQRE